MKKNIIEVFNKLKDSNPKLAALIESKLAEKISKAPSGGLHDEISLKTKDKIKIETFDKNGNITNSLEQEN